MKLSLGDRVFTITVHVLLVLLAFVTFYPFWNALVISFNEGFDTSLGGITFWPREFTFENYAVVFEDQRLMNGFIIAVLRTVVGTILSILATAIFAYGMTKKELVGYKFYMLLGLITMYFSGGLIPTYLLMRELHVIKTFWLMVIPGISSIWNMIVFRTFFKGLPGGLEESAKIDGCSNWGIFFRIIIPLSGPVIATLSLFTAITHWNDWFLPSIYITDDKLLPIQSMLRQILNSNIMTEQLAKLDSAAFNAASNMMKVTTKSLTMATMMVATIPIILVYPFVQKYFVKGVLIGSMKE